MSASYFSKRRTGRRTSSDRLVCYGTSTASLIMGRNRSWRHERSSHATTDRMQDRLQRCMLDGFVELRFSFFVDLSERKWGNKGIGSSTGTGTRYKYSEKTIVGEERRTV